MRFINYVKYIMEKPKISGEINEGEITKIIKEAIAKEIKKSFWKEVEADAIHITMRTATRGNYDNWSAEEYLETVFYETTS